MHWGTAPIRVPDKSLLSIGEVADALGYSDKTVRAFIKDGIFPPGKAIAGGEQRWSNMTVAAWLLWVEHCLPGGALPGKPGPEGSKSTPEG